MNYPLACAVSLAFIAASDEVHAAPDNDWPELFADAVAEHSGPKALYSYELVSTNANGDVQVRVAYDPLASDGQKFSILEFDEELDLEQDEVLTDFETDGDDIWCDDMAKSVKANVRKAAESEETITYTYTPREADKDADENQKKVVERTIATMVIDKESREPISVQYVLEKPFKPVFVAKVDKFQLFGQCKPTSSGRSYFSSIAVEFAVRALGQKMEEYSEQRVENLRLVKAANE